MFDVKNLNERIQEAMEEVQKVHANDMYGDHNYFNYHIMNVYSRVIADAINRGFHKLTLYKLAIIALYHDAFEDHKISLDAFEEKYGKEMRDSLVAISYNKGYESRDEYYVRVENDDYAKFVKYHDASENAYNCSLSNDIKRQEYYLKAVNRFSETRLT